MLRLIGRRALSSSAVTGATRSTRSCGFKAIPSKSKIFGREGIALSTRYNSNRCNSSIRRFGTKSSSLSDLLTSKHYEIIDEEKVLLGALHDALREDEDMDKVRDV